MRTTIPQNTDSEEQYKESVVVALSDLAEKLAIESENDLMIVLSAITLLSEKGTDAHKKLADYYYRNANWNGAIHHFEKCCFIDKSDFVSMFYLANSYKNICRYSDAIEYYKKSINIHEYPEGLMNLSSAYLDINNRDGEREILERLTEKFPEYTLGHYNLGIYWYGKKDLRKSIECYRKALQTNPAHGETKMALALALIMDKQYFDGFQMYENRWGVWENCPIRDFNRPLWHGEDVPKSSKILITLEQGFGDTLMMLRYINYLLERFTDVYIEVQPSMQRLIAKSFPKIKTVIHGDAFPATDFYCPIMSLPYAFRTGQTAIPSCQSYINIDEPNHFDKFFNMASKKLVGVCWRCGGYDPKTAHRSLSFDSIFDLFKNDEYTWVSLTKDVPSEELESMASLNNLNNWIVQVTDFYDTFMLINGLDVVITVDTAIAHLAGAMGKPTIVILNEGYDWKWTVDDQISAWYPLTQLFRAYKLERKCELVPELLSQIKKILS